MMENRKIPSNAEDHGKKSGWEKPKLQGTFYPFRKAWMHPMRLSVGIPVIVLIAALLVPLLLMPRLEEYFQASLGAGILAGVFLSLIALVWITVSITQQCNSFQILFVRAGGRLWRIDLLKLCRVGEWETLPPEKQEFIQATILWGLESIIEDDSSSNSSGDIIAELMSCAAVDLDGVPFFRNPKAVIELRNIQEESENRWGWTVSYETNSGKRKKLKIPKGYPDFIPVMGMERAEGPVPPRWMPALAALVLTAAFLCGGIALDLWRMYQKPKPDISVRVPEHITEYEMSEVRFQVDSDFQYSRRTFLDGYSGTFYRAYIQYGVDKDGAWDTL